MGFCTNCGQTLPDDAKFCLNCGKAVSHDNQPEQRETVYEGNVHKCPNCGEVISAFQTKCPACGHEFRDASATNAIKEFEKELERIENSGKVNNGGLLGTFEKAFSSRASKGIDQQLADKISNFAVPNNKEDIFEFMILAASNIDPMAYDNSTSGYSYKVRNAKLMVSNAWDSKYNQVHQKAKMLFPDEPRLIEIETLYSSKQKQVKKAKFKVKKNLIIGFSLLIALYALIFAVTDAFGTKEKKLDEQLNSTVAEIQIDIANGDYDAALVKAYTLHFDSDLSRDKAKDWDEQRELLIELINSKKGE